LNSFKKNSTICFFNSSGDWGGGEKWHFEMAAHLHSGGYNVVICTSPGSMLYQKAKNESIPVFTFHINNFSFLNPFLRAQLRQFFIQQGISHIIFNLPSDLKAGAPPARKASLKKIIYRRGSAKPIKNSFLNRYLFSRMIDVVIANSEKTKATVLEKNKNLFPKGKIKVIYNGIFTNEYNEAVKTPSNNIVLGTAGRLSPEKGHDRLLNVARKLKEKSHAFSLLIAGTGPEEESLKTKCHELELEEQVKFVGFVEPFISFLKNIDIFVLPSYYEGFGYVLIEAMAAKKPVISFNIGAAHEIISHEENGFIIPDDNLDLMAEKINTLLQKPELISSFGKNGRETVEKNFGFDAMAKKFLQVLTDEQ
jgi:glycosyltransferase involved in cell wall biosynthesis